MSADSGTAVLSLRGLTVSFDTPHGAVIAAEDVALSVARAECLGVVGESGAGKSQVFLGLMGLLAANGRVQGSARLLDTELLTLGPSALERVRGGRVGMVFQDPMTSLTPHLTVGEQIAEVLRRHRQLSRDAAREGALSLLTRVHVTDPARRLRQYPHQLSGGMRQRVMIAIALAGEPQLLIADEPTTALDVTIQAQILALLAELKRQRGLAMILITHDLGAVAGLADRIAVMRRGRVIETGTAAQVLKAPRDPYTRALVGDAARLNGARTVNPAGRGVRASTHGSAALAVTDLTVRFRIPGTGLARREWLTALDAASLNLQAGDSLGVVGESGSGKSTLVRAVLQLLPAAAGRVVWMGQPLHDLPPGQLRRLRRDLQMVFQDPLGSLDPRMTVAQIVAEPLTVHEPSLDAGTRTREVEAMLGRMGLEAALAQRYPHQLSGGQCQRVGIARAMILKPRLLVCDEPLSALDLATQAQIVTLMAELKQTTGMSLLFVSHNLALVASLCERVLVMYLGRMMELAPAAALATAARHPYTRELLAAVPTTDPDVQPGRLAHVLTGEPPSALAPPSGCVYRTRCPHAAAVCAMSVPAWDDAGGGGIACHRWRELT